MGAAPGPIVLGDAGRTCSVASICAQHELPVAQGSTQQAFVQMLVGDWALCEATSVFGTHEAGLSIVADGTWYKLYPSGVALTRGQGFDQQGTWTVIDTSIENGPTNQFQLNLNIAGSGTVSAFPAFAINPRKMRLNNNGVFVADYVFAACPQ
jgi:hypothetical protein